MIAAVQECTLIIEIFWLRVFDSKFLQGVGWIEEPGVSREWKEVRVFETATRQNARKCLGMLWPACFDVVGATMHVEPGVAC